MIAATPPPDHMTVETSPLIRRGKVAWRDHKGVFAYTTIGGLEVPTERAVAIIVHPDDYQTVIDLDFWRDKA